ncbi:type II secretion system protein [Candidatus Roizmanbacteria bacterium]|nr:type II secretion system protein [Candidatus Roizmanbacteria bacterium]
MRRGFTLIELLIVMGIIGLLTTLGFTNYVTSVKRARDAERKSDLKQIQKALELYKLDESPVKYPDTASFPSANTCWTSGGSGATCPAGNVYMRNVPGDGSVSYSYARDPADNLKYTLIACLENPDDPEGTACASCTSPKLCYTVTEP